MLACLQIDEFCSFLLLPFFVCAIDCSLHLDGANGGCNFPCCISFIVRSCLLTSILSKNNLTSAISCLFLTFFEYFLNKYRDKIILKSNLMCYYSETAYWIN
jgi:hypothetical protein